MDVTYVEGSLGPSCAHGGRKAVILSRCGGFHALLVGLLGLSNRIRRRGSEAVCETDSNQNDDKQLA